MELRQLKYFVTAADSLNFSRAAELMYVSQPTMSQQIADLENELGVQLFERSKRAVTLTAEGSVLLPLAKEILYRSELLLETAQTTHGNETVRGKVRIGFEPAVMDSELTFSSVADAVFSLRQQYPALAIQFLDIYLSEPERVLKREEIDLLVTTHNRRDFGDALHCLTLDTDAFELVYCSCQPAPETQEEIKELLLSMPVLFHGGEGLGTAHIMRLFNELNIQPTIQQMHSAENALLMVGSGVGCVAAPRSFRNKFPFEHVHFVPLDTPCNTLYTSLVWSREAPSPLIDLVAKTIQTQYKLKSEALRR